MPQKRTQEEDCNKKGPGKATNPGEGGTDPTSDREPRPKKR